MFANLINCSGVIVREIYLGGAFGACPLVPLARQAGRVDGQAVRDFGIRLPAADREFGLRKE